MKKATTRSGRGIDARKFQHQLARLANTIALKVEREGVKVTKPPFTAADITVMVRHSLSVYELMCFVNADDIRNKPGWKAAYVAAQLPLNRSMIDCLYNITTLLSFPSKRFAFRESGYKFALMGLRADEERHRGKKKWKEYIKKQRELLGIGMRADNITMAEVEAAKTWPTLSGYLRVDKGKQLTAHQEFLKKLAYVFWQEYSAMTHAVFQGLMPTAVFYIPDMIPHELREQFDTVVVEQMIATHLVRNAGILLCTLTEIQAHYRFFDEARINKRLHEVWNVLVRLPEIRELYDLRYAALMEKNGIVPE